MNRLKRIIHPQGRKALALFLYLLLLGMLAPFDWSRLLQPFPLLSVLTGMGILTASQFVKGQTWQEAALHARWNAFLAGLITSLLNLLSAFSLPSAASIDSRQLAGHLAPLLVGGLFSFLLDWLPDKNRIPDSTLHDRNQWPDSSVQNRNGRPDSTLQDRNREQVSEPATSNAMTDGTHAPAHQKNVWMSDGQEDPDTRFDVQTIQPILAAHGLTERECHVALKLMEDMPNRDIAATLFIAESTVKKHIQNLYRKCEAEDRRAFRRICLIWLQEARPQPQDANPQISKAEPQLPAD